jgi:hypothetical protein
MVVAYWLILITKGGHFTLLGLFFKNLFCLKKVKTLWKKPTFNLPAARCFPIKLCFFQALYYEVFFISDQLINYQMLRYYNSIGYKMCLVSWYFLFSSDWLSVKKWCFNKRATSPDIVRFSRISKTKNNHCSISFRSVTKQHAVQTKQREAIHTVLTGHAARRQKAEKIIADA